MTVTAGTRTSAVQRLYLRAHTLTERARNGHVRAHELVDTARRVVLAFEEDCGIGRGVPAGQHLCYWARELVEGNHTAAGVHLQRAGRTLGLGRGGSPRRSASRAAPAPAPAQPCAGSPVQRAPASAPPPASQPPSGSVWSALSKEEQALVASLPGASDPLEGSAALARCWGDAMSPTSARGRYSRLANKLREHCGREVLLRGRGRYARLEGWG